MLIRTQDKNAIYNLTNFCNICVSNYANSETCAVILTYADNQHYNLGHYNSREDALMVMNIIEHYYSEIKNIIYHMPQEDEVPVELYT